MTVGNCTACTGCATESSEVSTGFFDHDLRAQGLAQHQARAGEPGEDRRQPEEAPGGAAGGDIAEPVDAGGFQEVATCSSILDYVLYGEKCLKVPECTSR